MAANHTQISQLTAPVDPYPANLDRNTPHAYPLRMARPQLSFQVAWQERAARLSVTGDVDLLSAPSLVATIDEVLRERPETLVLDLTGVSFLDSAGISALARAYHAATAIGAQLSLTGARQMVRHVLEISGIDQVISVRDEPATS
jgi:anti-sigma B factor antagonist